MNNRLIGYFERANKTTREEGSIWYPLVNSFALGLSIDYSFKLETVASVISALSPACSWESNKKDAKTLIQAYREGNCEKVKVCTYGQNRAKAIALLESNSQLVPTRTNLKTFNFAQNIINPFANFVTIDRHAWKAFSGGLVSGSIKINPKLYSRAKNSYLVAAKWLGISVTEFQATVWLQYKKEVGR